MLLSTFINDSFGILSRQLKFYCWHFRRDLDQNQRVELIELLCGSQFDLVAKKIKSLNQNRIEDCKQQVGKILFEYCLKTNRRRHLIQLIESDLVDLDVRLDNYGRTLLHRSAFNLDVELVRLLIENGINIKLRDYAGNTALHIAIQSYRNGPVVYGNEPVVVQNLTKIIKLLLDADQDLQSNRLSSKRIKLWNKSQVQRPLPLTKETNNETKTNTKNIVMHPLNIDSSYTSTQAKFDHRDDQEATMSQKCCQELQSKMQTYSCNSTSRINPILLEDNSSSLVDTRNAFGRTALHYCVLVVGQQHISHFVRLLLSYDADPDATDDKMATPLHCLVRRPGLTAAREKLICMCHLVDAGCDDLGLAIDPQIAHRGSGVSFPYQDQVQSANRPKAKSEIDAIFSSSSFKRVPSLKHLVRLRLIKLEASKHSVQRQLRVTLPDALPSSLDLFMNRRVLDQSEFY